MPTATGDPWTKNWRGVARCYCRETDGQWDLEDGVRWRSAERDRADRSQRNVELCDAVEAARVRLPQHRRLMHAMRLGAAWGVFECVKRQKLCSTARLFIQSGRVTPS